MPSSVRVSTGSSSVAPFGDWKYVTSARFSQVPGEQTGRERRVNGTEATYRSQMNSDHSAFGNGLYRKHDWCSQMMLYEPAWQSFRATSENGKPRLHLSLSTSGRKQMTAHALPSINPLGGGKHAAGLAA